MKEAQAILLFYYYFTVLLFRSASVTQMVHFQA